MQPRRLSIRTSRIGISIATVLALIIPLTVAAPAAAAPTGDDATGAMPNVEQSTGETDAGGGGVAEDIGDGGADADGADTDVADTDVVDVDGIDTGEAPEQPFDIEELDVADAELVDMQPLALAATSPTESRPMTAVPPRAEGPFDFVEPSVLLDSTALGIPRAPRLDFTVYDAITADLDGNGTQDIVTQLYNPGRPFRMIGVQRTDGFGGVEAGTAYTVPDTTNSAFHQEGGLDAADVDGDGDLDLIATTGRGLSLVVLVNDGDGGFGEHLVTPVTRNLDRTLIVRDIDGDGIADVVAASWNVGGLVLLLGNGDGTFREQTDLLQHTRVLNVAAIELSDPGDVALISTGSQGAPLLWSTSGESGWTSTPLPIASGTAAWVADFDGDGDQDVAVQRPFEDAASTAAGVGAVTLLRNEAGALTIAGDYAFTDPIRDAGMTPARNRGDAHDIDGDGLPDLVLPGWYGDVAVLYADAAVGFTGRSAWAAAPGYDTGTPAGWDTRDPDWPRYFGNVRHTVTATVADITGDGTADLVVTTEHATPANAGSAPTMVSLIEGLGERRFGAAEMTAVSGGRWTSSSLAHRATVVDWDDDGWDDLLTLENNGSNALVHLARGRAGGFAPPQVIGTTNVLCVQGSNAQDLLVVDLDGDGVLDLVCGDYELYFTAGDGAGGLGTAVNLGRVSDSIYLDVSRLVATDADGDGDLDILYATTKTGSDRVWLGRVLQTDDGWGAPELIASVGIDGATHAQHGYPRPAFGDFDGDGRMDLAVASRVTQGTAAATLFVLTGQPDGTFVQQSMPLSIDGRARLDALDLDGDGALDLVANYPYSLGNYGQWGNTTSLLRGDGDGGFAEFQRLPVQSAGYGPFRVGDVNGDGLLDLVSGTNYRGAELRPGLPDGTFGPPVFFGSPGHGLVWLDLIDIDHDGDLDVVGRVNAAPSRQNSPISGLNVALLQNSGGGSTGPVPVTRPNLEPGEITLAPEGTLEGAVRATVSVTTKNTGDADAPAGWTDTVWLSDDDTWDIGDTLVATIERNEPLASGASVTATVEADLVPRVHGTQQLIVRVDTRGQVTEENEDDNLATLAIETDLPELAPGSSIVHAGGALPGLYRIEASATPLRLSLEGVAVVTVAPGRVPGDVGAELRLAASGAVLIEPGERRYVRVMSTDAATLILDELAFGAASIWPVVASDAGPATFTVTGVGLGRVSDVSFVGPGGERRTATFEGRADGALTARVDLAGAPRGSWALQVADGVETSELTSAVRVVTGQAGTVRTSVFVPSRSRVDGTGTVLITFRNDGLTDAVAPFYRVLSRGAGTPEGGPYRIGDFFVSPDVGTGGIVPPGAAGRIEIPFVNGAGPDKIPAEYETPRGTQFMFLVEEYGTGSVAPYDPLADFAEALAALPEGQRAGASSALAELFGSTGDSYVRALHAARATLGSGASLSELRRAVFDRAVEQVAPWSGAVLDADGAPVAGLLVIVTDAAGAEVGARTGSDGRWFADGIGEPVAVFADGYGPAPIATGDVTQARLPRWAALSGAVALPGGEPVAGAAVIISDDAGGRAVAVTDADGVYRFAGASPGTHQLSAVLGDAAFTGEIAVGTAAQRVDIALEAVTDPETPGPSAGFAVSGIVRADGVPVEGASVSVEGADAVATGPDGRFELDGIAGDVHLDVTAGGYLPASVPISVAADLAADVDLEPAAELRVTVRDTRGGPLEGRIVEAVRDLSTVSAETAADGVAELLVPVGEHTVSAGGAAVVVTATAGSNEVEIVVPNAQITGTVPAGGAVVWVVGDGDTWGVISDEDGLFTLTGDPGVSAELRVFDPVAGVIRQPITFPADDEIVDLGRLAASGHDLSIHMPWRVGTTDPAPFVYLAPADDLALVTFVFPDVADGSTNDTLVVPRVPDGEYVAIVDRGEGVADSRARVAVAGADVTVTMTDAVTAVAAGIEADEGTPYPNARVSLRSTSTTEPPREYLAYPDENGAWSITVAAGAYEVIVDDFATGEVHTAGERVYGVAGRGFGLARGAVEPFALARAAMLIVPMADDDPIAPVDTTAPSKQSIMDMILDAFTVDDPPPLDNTIEHILGVPYPQQDDSKCLEPIDFSLLVIAKAAAGKAADVHKSMGEQVAAVKKQLWVDAGEVAARGIMLINDLISLGTGFMKVVGSVKQVLGKSTKVLATEAVERAAVGLAKPTYPPGWQYTPEDLQSIADLNKTLSEIKLLADVTGKLIKQVRDGLIWGPPGGLGDIVKSYVNEYGPLWLEVAESMSATLADTIANTPFLSIAKESFGMFSAVTSIWDNVKEGSDSFTQAIRTIEALLSGLERLEVSYRWRVDVAKAAWRDWVDSDKTREPKDPAPPECVEPPPPPPPDPGPDGPYGPGGGTSWNSNDPNEIGGPLGVGDERWVQASVPLVYEISFENLGPGSAVIPEGAELATAPAADVVVTLPLGEWVDADAAALGEFGFGADGILFQPAPGAQSFSDERPFSVTVPDEHTGDPVTLALLLRASAVIDPVSREAVWRITLVDPATGLRHPDALAGFLPPEPVEAPGAGAGFARIELQTAQPRTGQSVSAQASIVFDTNDAIATNTWTNTLDGTAPEAVVFGAPAARGLVAPLAAPGFVSGGPVSLSAIDAGSGAARYDVWRSVDGGPLEMWQYRFAGDQLVIEGEVGQRIGLAARATDRVFNAGAIPDEVAFEVIITAAPGPAVPDPGDPGTPGGPGASTGAGQTAGGSSVSAQAESGATSLPRTGAELSPAWVYLGVLLVLAGLAALRAGVRKRPERSAMRRS